jgi:ABC-type iron transport system FetAB permease component
MENAYLKLTYFQVGRAAMLIPINGKSSVFLKFGLERRRLRAALVTIAQLPLIGFVLDSDLLSRSSAGTRLCMKV